MTNSTQNAPRWTGHPLLDIGVAALCAMRSKTRPEELTLAELDAAAEEIEQAYSLKYLNAYLTCLYPNGAFTNPTMGSQAREVEARRALCSHWTQGSEEVRCVFTGEPAVTVLDRRHVPLMSGTGILSFAAGGFGGLPVAGWVPLALHALAFGARRCLGRALAVHADAALVTLHCAQRAVEYNRREIALAHQATDGKYSDAKAPLTLVVATLRSAAEAAREALDENRPTAVTVYHLTNSGQGADLDIHTLDTCAVRFVLRAASQKYRGAFDEMVISGWRRQLVVDGKGNKKLERVEVPSSPDPSVHRNYVYEDLFMLPQEAARFVRVHLLGSAAFGARLDRLDPRSHSRVLDRLGHHSWPLTDLFLTEILRMEKARIEAIRSLGDRMAEHIARENDRALFRELLQSRKYVGLRARLVRASAGEVRRGRRPLAGLDEFLLVFEHAEEVARSDWALARDLLCLRVLEQLHGQGYFREHGEVLEDLGTESNASEMEDAEEGAVV